MSFAKTDGKGKKVLSGILLYVFGTSDVGCNHTATGKEK